MSLLEADNEPDSIYFFQPDVERVGGETPEWFVDVDLRSGDLVRDQGTNEYTFKRKFTSAPHSAVSFEFSTFWDDLGKYEDQLAGEVTLIGVDGLPYTPINFNRQLEAVVKINSSSGLSIGILGESEQFTGLGEIDGKAHDYYNSDTICDGEYVYRNGSTGQGFISLVNSTYQEIGDVELEILLRDARFTKDSSREISTRRDLAIEYEDVPENATRRLSWDEANTFCAMYGHNGYTDWRLPTPDELAGTAFREAGDNTGAFIHHVRSDSALDSYWSDDYNSVTDKAWAVSNNGVIGTPYPRNERMLVRCVRNSSNMCEVSQ